MTLKSFEQLPGNGNVSENHRRETADCGRGVETMEEDGTNGRARTPQSPRAINGMVVPPDCTPDVGRPALPAQENHSSASRPKADAQTVSAHDFENLLADPSYDERSKARE